jgi:sugar phosphate isomerase/epimerase
MEGNPVIRRRQFIAQLAGGLVAASALGRNGFGATAGIGKIGLQLYTVRRELQKDFEGTLAQVAGIGYSEVEFAGYYDRTPQQVKEILARDNLSAPSSHMQLPAMRQNLDKMIEAAKIIGHEYVALAYRTPDERKTIDDFKQVAESLNKAGETCHKVGIQLAYHNHDFEFVPMGGDIPFNTLLKGTDPNLVKLELDLYWLTKAKQPVAEMLTKLKGRVALVHIKDMDNTPKQFFTEVGRGIIDYKSLLPLAQKAGVKHYFVEQDECPGSPLDSIKISYDYLSRVRL